jgi:hypothetical protein
MSDKKADHNDKAKRILSMMEKNAIAVYLKGVKKGREQTVELVKDLLETAVEAWEKQDKELAKEQGVSEEYKQLVS